MKSKTVLVTGGCGFIGHHLVEHLLRKTNWNIVILDKLTYASMGYERLRSFVFGEVCILSCASWQHTHFFFNF